MTENEKTTLLTTLTGETDATVINYALLRAKEAILRKAFPFLSILPSELPAKYETTQIEIAEYLILKRGAGGETERVENGITQRFESGGIPASMLRHILPRCKTLRTVEAEESDNADDQETTESEGDDAGT